jgi:hypothetical protein
MLLKARCAYVLMVLLSSAALVGAEPILPHKGGGPGPTPVPALKSTPSKLNPQPLPPRGGDPRPIRVR